MPIIERVLLGLPPLLLATSLLAGPQIQTWTTSNGARVFFVEAPQLPMLDLRVVFKAGSAWNATPGLANLTNAMLDQGAGEWDADQIAERLANVGSTMDNNALRDMAWVSVRSLTSEPALGLTLDTLSKVLAEPRFPQQDFERLRRLTLVAINRDGQKPRSIGSKALYHALYAGHAYAEDPLGTREAVQVLTRDQLIDHYRRYYVARNAVLAMVGAVDRAQAERIAEQVSAGLAPGDPAPAPAAVLDLNAPSSRHIDFPSSQAHLYIGQPGISRGDPDYFPLYVGNHILGGSGLVSILSEEVREKRGLSYSVYSYFLPMLARGPFLSGLQTKGTQVGQARQVLMDTLRRFREQGPTVEELTASKQNITGGFPLRIASNGKIVEYLSVIGFYALPLNYLDSFNAKVEAVSAEQVRSAFLRRLDPDRMVTIVVGPAVEGK